MYKWNFSFVVFYFSVVFLYDEFFDLDRDGINVVCFFVVGDYFMIYLVFVDDYLVILINIVVKGKFYIYMWYGIF